MTSIKNQENRLEPFMKWNPKKDCGFKPEKEASFFKKSNRGKKADGGGGFLEGGEIEGGGSF